MDLRNVNDVVDKIGTIQSQALEKLRFIAYYSQAMIGDYKYSARSSDAHGWLVCDGRSLDLSQYPALYEVIGTAFGTNGGNTFNLPDFRGRVPGIIGNGAGLTNRTLGTSVGNETHSLTVDEMPSHNHGITDPGHVHGGDDLPGGVQSTDNAFGTEDAAQEYNTTNNVDSAVTGITINNAGGGQPHNNMQPTLFGGRYMIFAGILEL